MAFTPVTTVVAGNKGTATWGNAVQAAVTELQATEWVAYTPNLGGAGWSLGSTGSDKQGAYCVDGHGVVHFWVRLVFGTVGATFAAAVPTVSLPVNADASQVAYAPRASVQCGLTDTSAGIEYPAPAELTATVVNMMVVGASATYATFGYAINTIPFTWAVSDVIRVAGWYRKA